MTGGDLVIGIDPGVNTGLAIWSRATKSLVLVETTTALRAMRRVEGMKDRIALMVMEDARLRKWFGNSGREVLQGAGSVKRDCSLWTEFAEIHGLPLKSISPQGKGAKVNAEAFVKITGWTKRTSEHARDAAMLAYQA